MIFQPSNKIIIYNKPFINNMSNRMIKMTKWIKMNNNNLTKMNMKDIWNIINSNKIKIMMSIPNKNSLKFKMKSHYLMFMIINRKDKMNIKNIRIKSKTIMMTKKRTN